MFIFKVEKHIVKLAGCKLNIEEKTKFLLLLLFNNCDSEIKQKCTKPCVNVRYFKLDDLDTRFLEFSDYYLFLPEILSGLLKTHLLLLCFLPLKK